MTAKTVRDLMDLTGLSRPTVHRGIESGALPGYKVGTAFFCTDDGYELLKTNQWVPRPRRTFPNPVHALPQPSDLIKKVG